MSDFTTNLALPFLQSGQAQKHVTVNESLLRLDLLAQLCVVSATTSAQPASPADGVAYILPSGKTGADWGGMVNHAIAYYRDGVWEQISPREGWLAFVRDTDAVKYYDGAAWAALSAGGADLSGAIAFLGDLSPSQITANQNDFDPSGLSGAGVLRVSSDASRTLTGLAGGADGRVICLVNVGANPIVLADESASSSAANRFSLGGASLTVAAKHGAFLIYDSTDSRWRNLLPRHLGTAASKDTGASGDAVPLLNVSNTWSQNQTLSRGASIFSLIFQLDGNSGDVGQVLFDAKDSANNTTSYAMMRGAIVSNTDGAENGEYMFRTAQNGALTTVAKFAKGIYTPGASGGDRGIDTINAVAVYDDNVLLTCGPIELQREGAIDLAKWDALVPDRVAIAEEGRPERREKRQHLVMRHFQAMLDDGFDPRDADNFCARMKADGAAPGLFTETEWRTLASAGEKPDMGTAMTRTFLALDNLAVAFSALVDRVARLESSDRSVQR